MIVWLRKLLLLLGLALAGVVLPVTAGAEVVGVVLMHGKGGQPSGLVAELAAALEAQGLRVANLEMPWSGRRQYDVDVPAAEREVLAALASLRERGATRLFVVGHSQGGLFALYFAGRHDIDGVVAIAPGGNVGNRLFREKLGETVDLARRRVAEGGGDEPARLADYENAKGVYPVVTTPAVYLSWFEPEGAMNQTQAIRNLRPGVPVLYIVPTGDYPALRRLRQLMFDGLPAHPASRLYEPEASHAGAPSASVAAIVDWLRMVAR